MPRQAPSSGMHVCLWPQRVSARGTGHHMPVIGLCNVATQTRRVLHCSTLLVHFARFNWDGQPDIPGCAVQTRYHNRSALLHRMFRFKRARTSELT